MLIEQIVAAPSVESVTVNNLPSAISGYVNENHAPFNIVMAFHAEPHGYAVQLFNYIWF